jgi:hypothetical protein
MKTLRLIVLFCLCPLLRAATPLVDAQLSGANNQVKSGATLTIKSGSTVFAEAGATVPWGSGSMVNPMTASGDLIVGGTAGAPTRLPKGTDGWVLSLVSGVPAWVVAPGASLTGMLKGTGSAFAVATGGTDFVAPGAFTASGLTLTSGKILGRTSASTGAAEEIAIGSGLSMSGGVLTATGSVSGSNPTASISTNAAVNGSAGTFMRSDSAPGIATSANLQFGRLGLGVGPDGSNPLTILGTATASMWQVGATQQGTGATGAAFTGAGLDNSTSSVIMYHAGNAIDGTLFIGAKCRGTPASPSATQTGDNLNLICGGGYGTLWNLTSGTIGFYASEAWSSGHNGTNFKIGLTPNASTTCSYVMQMDNSAVSFSVQLIGKGTATNDAPSAGYIGEVISSTIATGSSVTLTSITGANVTSISLTAGDWDVYGTVAFTVGSTTTVGYLAGGINTASATLPTTGTGAFVIPGAGTNATVDITLDPQASTPYSQISIAGTTTVYLVAQAKFGTSTCKAYGRIYARRAR